MRYCGACVSWSAVGGINRVDAGALFQCVFRAVVGGGAWQRAIRFTPRAGSSEAVSG